MNERDCKHGRLARKCEQCDTEQEIAELKAEATRLREALTLLTDEFEGCGAMYEKVARAALAAHKREA